MWLSVLLKYVRAPLTVAPVLPWSRHLARYKFRVLQYMDDLLFVSYEPAGRTHRLIHLLHGIFEASGVALSPDKSVFSPVRECEYLGYLVNMNGTIKLMPKCYHKLLSTARELLSISTRTKCFIPFKWMQHFLGVLCSCYEAVLWACVWACPLYDCMATYNAHYAHASPDESAFRSHGVPHHRVKLTHPATAALVRITNLAVADCTSSCRPPALHARLVTNALLYRWAAVLEQHGQCRTISGSFLRHI